MRPLKRFETRVCPTHVGLLRARPSGQIQQSNDTDPGLTMNHDDTDFSSDDEKMYCVVRAHLILWLGVIDSRLRRRISVSRVPKKRTALEE